MHPEIQRIAFISNRDGLKAAKEFAGRTYRIYRKALMNKNHHARLPQYRKSFIESYLILKRYSVL